MRRRDFLVGTAAAGLFAGRGAWAAPWGEPHVGGASEVLLQDGARAESVLEVFLYGGLSPFESFYVVDEYGKPDDPDYPNQQWYLFQDAHAQRFGDCQMPEGLTPFSTDSLGKTVNLGPLVAPLIDRPDILARMRILVHRHDLEPHEAAIPLALSGMRLGSPRMAGVGAAVQRWNQERDTSGRRVPFSYVLYPVGEIPTDNLRAASAVGLHPGSARPLDLRIEGNSSLPERLARNVHGARRADWDELVAYYHRKALERYSVEGEVLRSGALSDHRFATESLRSADELRQVFTDEILARLPGQACGQQSNISTPAMSLNIAAHLLTHPVFPARHVTIVDGGLYAASGGGGYDVHSGHLDDTSRNLVHTLRQLAQRIAEPGDDDPAKINLDKTLVVLNTEFGRTPFKQAGSFDGTNHHPYGYVSVMIGGPIAEGQAGVVGAIGPDGRAVDGDDETPGYVTCAEARAAILAAVGIYPFQQETFAVGDVRAAATELDGLKWLHKTVLGLEG